MEFEATNAFVLTWACFIVALLVLECPERLFNPLFDVLDRIPTHHGIRNCLRIPSRTLYVFNHQRVTLYNYVVVGLYIFSNGLLFARPDLSDGFQIVRADSDELRRRAAVAATINLVPVVLGGRTCFLVDAFNIPLQRYYFAHHWLARLAVVEMTMHAVLHVRSGTEWTTQAVCGLVVSAPCPYKQG
jgi:hypothetical protein